MQPFNLLKGFLRENNINDEGFNHSFNRRMRILVLISLFSLVACGPSVEEKQNVAIITCNIMEVSIMEEPINMGAATRIKEINEAREKIHEDPFLFGDKKIIESFKYELCTNLVLNDPNYDVLLKERKLAAEEAQKKRKAEMKEELLAKQKLLAEIEEKRLAEEEAKRIKRLKEEEAAKKIKADQIKVNGFCEIFVVGFLDDRVFISEDEGIRILGLGDSYKTSKDSFRFSKWYPFNNEIIIVWENEKTGAFYSNTVRMNCERILLLQ